MAATLNPKFAKTTTPINSALTAAVKAAKPITLPTVANNTNIQSAKPAVTQATGTSSPLKTVAAPAVTAPTTTAPSTSAPTTNSQNNWNALNNDSAYLTSEIARAQKVKADRAAQGLGTTDQDNYLTKLTGISSGTPYVPGTGATTGAGTTTNTNGLPPELSWLGANSDNEVKSQILSYQEQQEAARQAAQAGVDANNRYLAEQIEAMQRQRAVDMDSLQQQQNRFGGLYSGGLNYQGGQINSSYANQQGALTRDIAARNQQLMDQYGTQANTIASQIQNLQANEPGIIRDRINDYLTQYAGLYGSNPLNPNQSTLAGKNANLNAALQVGQQTGYNVSPQNDWQGLYRQPAQGTDAMGNPLTKTAGQAQTEYQNTYNEGRDKVADQQWQSGVDQDIYKLLADQASAGTQPAATGPSVSTISTNINRALSALGNNVKVTDPAVRNQIDQIILTQTQDPNTIAQLYTMYGIPIPADLQAELSSNFSAPSSNALGGVLSGKGDAFAKYGSQYGVDPTLLAAISMWETGRGTSSMAKNKNNVGGMYDSKNKTFYTYGSIDEGIEAMARNLAKNYINQGLTTIPQIQQKYAPSGAANDPNGLNNNWVKGVTSIYNELKGK